MSYLPLFLKQKTASSVLIIGGGEVATAKAEALLGCGLSVHILASAIGTPLKELQEQHPKILTLTQKTYESSDLVNHFIIVAATNDIHLNKQIQQDAHRHHKLVNVVDNPELCDFIFPALVKRGNLQIAISSSGISPVLARLIKQKIEQILPWNFEKIIDFVSQKRKLVRTAFKQIQARRLFWEKIFTSPLPQEILEGNSFKAEKIFQETLSDMPDEKQSALYLVSAGPGHPDLITVKGIQLISQGDVILYDRLVSPVLLEQYARKDALKVSVGKGRDHHSKTQDEIDDLIAYYLKQNKIVVRLKGGDTSFYAHTAEEIAVAQKLNVPYQIVAGVTAASGCAATAGIALTQRNKANSVRVLTLSETSVGDESFWQSLSHAHNDTLVFYMSLKHKESLIDNLLRVGFRPNTPILAVEQGTTPNHTEYEATLETFMEEYGEHSFLSPVLFMIGDVINTRHGQGWKEKPVYRQEFFRPLIKKTENTLYDRI